MESCPNDDTLRSLEMGELADETADHLLPHIEQCESCVSRLEQFRGQSLDARVIRAAVASGGYSSTATAESPTQTRIDSLSGSGANWAIPDYDRERLCGEGAFGSVWAVRARVGVYRALKVIDLARLPAADVRCRESTALESYCRQVRRHPNLIEIFHVGMSGDSLYYTMELADDDSTREPVRDTLSPNYRPLTLRRVMSKGTVTPETALEIVLQLLRGLSRLHAAELAHRDIKPANIVFVNRRPKVADIGMITTETDSPSKVGTPQYMPPDKQMDLTADVFAMGRILHQLLTGSDPTEVPAFEATFSDGSHDWNLDEVRRVIRTACAPLAAERYSRADRMLEALESCRQMSYDSLFAELESAPAPPPALRRHVWVPIVIQLIRVLPWLGVLILAAVLAHKYL